MDLIIITLIGNGIGIRSHLLTYLRISMQLMFQTVWTLTQIPFLCMTTIIASYQIYANTSLYPRFIYVAHLMLELEVHNYVA